MEHMDSKYNIKNITSLKMQNLKTGEVYDMPCESISIAPDFNDVDFSKAQTFNFEAVLNGDINTKDFITTATSSLENSIRKEIEQINNTLNSTDFNTACEVGKRISKIMIDTNLSSEEMGKALKTISERLKDFQEIEKDIFLETLNSIKKESEELINGIYG